MGTKIKTALTTALLTVALFVTANVSAQTASPSPKSSANEVAAANKEDLQVTRLMRPIATTAIIPGMRLKFIF